MCKMAGGRVTFWTEITSSLPMSEIIPIAFRTRTYIKDGKCEIPYDFSVSSAIHCWNSWNNYHEIKPFLTGARMITNNFVLFSILAPQKQVASPVEVGPSDLFCVWRVYWWCTQTKDYCCFPTTDECDPLFTFNGPIGAHKLPVNLASCWGASHTKWMDGFSEATALLPQLW